MTTLPMLPAVAACLTELADRAPDLVIVVADGHALGKGVKAAYPERFVDVGIAEASLVGVAAGIARTGRRVIATGMAPFLTRRAAEQVRNDVATAALAVTFVGVGGGLSYGTLGPTHHAPEDLVTFGNLPHTRVYCPADAASAAWSVRDAVETRRPAYVRLSAREDPVVHQVGVALSASSGEVLRPGKEGGTLLIATGASVAVGLKAAELLAGAGIAVAVLALTIVTPFPREQVVTLARSARTVCTVEDHVRSGGIGEATAAALAGHWQGRLVLHAVDTRYPPIGDREELFEFYGIGVAHLVDSLLSGHNTAAPPFVEVGL